MFTRDIKEAYTQANSELERIIYLKLVAEMKLEEGIILVAAKPLYGIQEAGLHWYLTYLAHHVKFFGMKQATVDT